MGRFLKQTARKSTGVCFYGEDTDEDGDFIKLERQCTGDIVHRPVDRLSYLLNRDSDEDSNDSVAGNFVCDHNSSNLEFPYPNLNLDIAPQSQSAKKPKIEENPCKADKASKFDKEETIDDKFENSLSNCASSPLHGTGHPLSYETRRTRIVASVVRKSIEKQRQNACKSTVQQQTIINNEIETGVILNAILVNNEGQGIDLPKIEIVTEIDGMSPYQSIDNKRIELPKCKNNPVSPQLQINPVSELYELCSKKKIGYPEFSIVYSNAKPKSRKHLMKVRLNKVVYQPEIGSSDLKTAKIEAAICCLKALKILI